MTKAPHITYAPTPNTMPEQACDTRARAWAFVFDCWQKKQGGPDQKAAPNDTKEGLNGSCRKVIIPE